MIWRRIRMRKNPFIRFTSLLWVTILIASSFTYLPLWSMDPFQTGSADNDPPPQGGHVEGDWTVTDARSYTSCTITLHGNLIIQGSLTFNDVTLLIQSDETTTFMINVTGSFTVTDLDDDPDTPDDASVIAPEDLEFRFDMNIATTASVEIRNSVMRAYDDISVLSSNVNFFDNSFTDLLGAGIDSFGCAPTFRGNNVSYLGQSGNAFVFYGCNGLVFEDNRIDMPWFHVIADGCEDITFRNNEFLRGDRGIVVHGTTALIEDNYFEWNGKTVVVEEGTAVVRGNTFFQNAAAMATDEFTTNDLEAYDNHIEECGEAFLLPGPGSESTARIHDNTILNCGGAVGLFTGFSARIYNNHIEGCAVALYTTGSVAEFYGNTIINGSFVFYSRHSGVTVASNNLIANNLVVAYLTEGSQLELENNALRFNLMGIHTYERNSGNARVIMTGNDVYDNPLYAIWNVDESASIDAENNYWGGVPNEDGDRIVGPDIIYEPYSNSPNNPITPANPITPHLVTGSESFQGELEASGPWVVRQGGNLDLEEVDFDLNGHFIGVKKGGALTASGRFRSGSALALSSDAVRLSDLNVSDMEVDILAFFGSPRFRNISLATPTREMPREMLPRSLIWSAMSDPVIEDCDFIADTDVYDILFDRSRGTVRNSSFTAGKGVEALLSTLLIHNCTFRANATGITTSETQLTLSENDLDSIAVNCFGSNVVLSSNEVDNTTLDFDQGNGTVRDNEFLTSSPHFRGSSLTIENNSFVSSDLRLSYSNGSFRNNTVKQGSRLTLSDFRGLITGNSFRNGDPAITIARGTAHINYNNFMDNQVAVSNTGSNTINAIYNYWNSENGPGGDGSGSGDPISGNILYEPWSHSSIGHEGAVLNFAPHVSLDEYDPQPNKSLLLSGWAWDPDGDSFTVEVRITGSQYDTGWVLPVQFERHPGWTRWYYLWDPDGAGPGSFHPEARASDGLTTTYAEDPGTFLFSPPDYSDHTNIQIHSDADFLLPSSGVTGGSGTESDPYVISGWTISPYGNGANTVPAIEIRNVQSHVVIEDCYFTGGIEDSWYISILDSPHVTTIRNNVFNSSEGGGLYGLNEVGTPITMNVTDNLFAEIESLGVRLKNYSLEATENHVVGDFWTGGPMYVNSLIDNEDALVRDNVFFNTDDGFVFQDIDGEVLNNLFLGCTAGGMIQTSFSDLSIHDNLFARCAFGSIFNGGVPSFENNTFIGNQKISHYNGQNQGLSALFRNNIFKNNVEGITNSFGGYSDARYNYWGAPDGPSGEGPGSGDPVDDLTEYEPWHTEEPRGNNHPPRVMFIEPWGGNDIAREEIELVWYATDLDGDDITVNLSYSPVNNMDNRTSLVELKNEYRYTWDVAAVPDGLFVIHAEITDTGGLGHQALSGMVEVRKNLPPVFDILEPDGNDDGANAYFTIEWRASDPDGDAVTIDLYYDPDTDPGNGKTLIADGLSNAGSYRWDTSQLPDGSYYIYGVADDRRGGITGDYSPGRVYISHTWNYPPEVEITSPDDDSTVSGIVTLRGAAHDDDGDESIEKVEVKIGEGNWQLADGTSSWELELDTTGYPDGWYDIVARAYDGQEYSDEGAEDASVSLEFYNPPPNVAPGIEINYPANESTVKGNITISGESSDENGDDTLEKVEIRVDEGGWKATTAIGGEREEWTEWEFLLDTTELEDGWHTISVRAFDGETYSDVGWIEILVGNTVQPEPNVKPEIVFFNADRQKYKTSGSAVFSAEVFDPNGPDDITEIALTLKIIEDGSERTVSTFHRNDMGLDTIDGRDGEILVISFSLQLMSFKPGDYSTVLEVSDSEGESASESWEFRIEKKKSDKDGDENIFESNELLLPAVGACAALGVFGAMVMMRRKRNGKGDDWEYDEQHYGDTESDEDAVSCPACGGGTQYSEDEDDHYCWECEEYVGTTDETE